MYWHPRIHRACHLRPASVSTARKKQSRLSRLSVLESWNTAATAERSGAMSLVIPKNRSMKCDESADEQQFHTMTRSRRAVSILSIPKQSRHLLLSSERSGASPAGCPPGRYSVTGFRVAPRQNRQQPPHRSDTSAGESPTQRYAVVPPYRPTHQGGAFVRCPPYGT